MDGNCFFISLIILESIHEAVYFGDSGEIARRLSSNTVSTLKFRLTGDDQIPTEKYRQSYIVAKHM